MDTQPSPAVSATTPDAAGHPSSSRLRIGIDLGGTKIEGIVIDARGHERRRERVPTPRGDYEATLTAVGTLVSHLEAAECHGDRALVGIGMPGAVSPASGLIKNANSTWLNGRPFTGDITRVLDRPVRVANDADCFALSEATDGAAAGAPVVFGVIIGTGVGGGIVVNQRLCLGPNAIAGEWGHNMLPWPREGEWPGPPCYCGRTACIETFLSGPGLERDYAASSGAAPSGPTSSRAATSGPTSSRAATSGVQRSTIEIAQLAQDGDPLAEAAIARYEHRLARGLASVINVLDPTVIVLGGGMSNLERLYESVPRIWTAFVFSDRVDTRLVRAAHGDSSGVRGAAWLWQPGEHA